MVATEAGFFGVIVDFKSVALLVMGVRGYHAVAVLFTQLLSGCLVCQGSHDNLFRTPFSVS